MLHLLYGKNMNDIKLEILNMVSDLSKENSEIYLVVPEMFTYSSEIQVMDFLKLESMINIKIMSFQRLTQTVLSQIGGIKRQSIDDVGKALIIRKLMNENPEEYKLYKGMVDKDGFYTKIISLIKEFKSNLVEPNVIDDISKACNKDLLREKLQEISLIYKGLEHYLENKYVDNEDRLNQLLEVLVDNGIYKNKNVIFWQFSGFSQLEYNIISTMVKMGTKITIGLVYDENHKDYSFEATKKTKTKLIEIAQGLDSDITEHEVENKFCMPNYVQCFGNTINEEISLVARKIRLLIDEKINYGEIAIVPTNQEYTGLIKRVFNEYNIPILVNNKEKLITTAVASWIKNMLDTVIYGFKYENVIAFLKSRLNIFQCEEVQVFENFVLRKNIRGEMYFREKYFSEDSFISEEEEQLVKKVKTYIENGFVNIKKISKTKLPLKIVVEEFFDTLKAFDFITLIDCFLDELEKESLLKEVEIVEQSYSAIIDIIDQMVEILGDNEIDLIEFSNLLESGFKQKSIGAIPQGNNQILISSIQEGLSGNYKYLFIMGATNESLPQAKKAQGLLSEQELTELNVKEIGLNTRKSLDLEEIHSIYKLLTFPEKMVVFSYSKIGTDGRKQKPSKYIRDYNAQVLKVESDWELRFDPMLYELSDIVRDYIEYDRIDDEKLYLLKRAKATKLLEGKLSTVLRDTSLEKPDFKINEAKARLIYPEPLELSVTRIHQISRCEFAHFIKYGLVPKERKVATMEPKEMGTLLHGFVEDFSKEIKNNPNIIDINDEKGIDDIIDNIYESKVRVFLDEEALESHRNTYLLTKLKRSARTLSKLLIDQVKESEFKLLGQEIYFGKGDSFKEVDLSTNNYSAWIKGQIDRVDIYEENDKNYIRIVDYKSSGKTFSLSDNYNILDVQLVIYMAAVLDTKENSSLGGAFYLPLLEKQIAVEDSIIENIMEKRKESYKMDGIATSDETILRKMDQNFDKKDASFKMKGRGIIEERSNLLSEKEFLGLVDHVKAEIKVKLDDLFAGNVRINPYIKENNDSGCKYCNYRSICGFDEKISKERLKKLSEYDTVSIKRRIGGDK